MWGAIVLPRQQLFQMLFRCHNELFPLHTSRRLLSDLTQVRSRGRHYFSDDPSATQITHIPEINTDLISPPRSRMPKTEWLSDSSRTAPLGTEEAYGRDAGRHLVHLLESISQPHAEMHNANRRTVAVVGKAHARWPLCITRYYQLPK